MKIPTTKIKALRDSSGAGVIDCRNALLETDGNEEEALRFLKERSLFQVQKKAERSANQGIVETYVHTGGHIGAMIELNCETDFVARTDEFKELAHNLVMQIAAMSPQFVNDKEVPEGTDVKPQEACLLFQPYIKSPDMTIQDIINETIARVGENIKVRRFTRFELGT